MTQPAATSEVVVQLEGVTYRYDGTGHGAGSALEGVTLSVARGSRVLLVGANGSGKSTLLRVVAGMAMAKGTARVLGADAFGDTSLNDHVQFIGEPWPASANWTSTVRQTVERYPNVDWQRFDELCRVLHVDPAWRVDHCSTGMKRRIQILLGLLRPKQVLCLDECTSDLDVVERENVLLFMRAASGCAANPVTILYATHIFDHLEGWPTHIAHMHEGRLTRLLRVDELKKPLLQQAFEWIQGPAAVASQDACHFPPCTTLPTAEVAVEVRELTYSVGRANLGKFSTAKRILEAASLQVPRGARVLMLGTNGSGKTSLLQALAGKHYVAPGHAWIFGQPVFHEPRLNAVLAFSGDWWDVPPAWDMSVAEVLKDRLQAPRVQHLLEVLGVNPAWYLRRVSSGQRKRIQLLLHLQEPRQVLLLDEVTAELDVVQRVAFMRFLLHESDTTGCTVLYSTHILEGLDGWATHVLCVDQLTKTIVDVPVPAGTKLLDAADGVLRPFKAAEWARLQ